MKRFRVLIAMMLAILTCIMPMGSIFSVSGTSDTANAEALQRINSLSVLEGNPDSKLTREQFIEVISFLLGMDEDAAQVVKKEEFLDTIPGTLSNGYLYNAYKQGLLPVGADHKVRPYDFITYSEVCEIVVNVLKHWALAKPDPKLNPIENASLLGLNQGLNLRSTLEIPRWATAVILDNMWISLLKANNHSFTQKASLLISSLTAELIVIGDSTTIKSLSPQRISTNIGTLTLLDQKTKLFPGNEYSVVLYGDILIKVNKQLASSLGVTVKSILGNTIVYSSKGVNEEKMILPEYVKYYNKGNVISFDEMLRALKVNSVLVFNMSATTGNYDFAVLIDPTYSEPQIAKEYDATQRKVGTLVIPQTALITKNGKIITTSQIQNHDVLYKVDDVYSTFTYYEVVNEKVDGEITGILPHKLSPSSIQIDGKDYDLSKDMDIRKINTAANAFKVKDQVTALLDRDGKVIDLIPITYEAGPYVECILLGNSTTHVNLSEDQILTDKGVLGIADGVTVECGHKYEAVIKNEVLVKVREKLSTITSLSVKKSIGNKITYTEADKSKTLYLPSSTTYYYNGKVIAYENVSDLLKVNSTIIFGSVKNKSGYVYALIMDPTYGVSATIGNNSAFTTNELIVMGNSTTSQSLSTQKISTNIGIFTVLDDSMTLLPGFKYSVVLYKDMIVSINHQVENTFGISVKSIVGNTLVYSSEDKKDVKMVFPEYVKYYKNGSLVAYDELANVIKVNSAIVFNYNESLDDYDFAVLIDPCYSVPQIKKHSDATQFHVGSMVIPKTAVITREGKMITPDLIRENDVVYKVEDVYASFTYYHVVTNKVDGELTGILPNKLSPRTLQIGGKDYDVSSNMDISKINAATDSFKVKDKVTALLDKDGKILDLVAITYEAGPFVECLILGNSTTHENLMERQLMTDQGILEYAEGVTVEYGQKYEAVIKDHVIVRVREKLSTLTNVSVRSINDKTVTYLDGNTKKTLYLPYNTTYYHNGKVVAYDGVSALIEANTSIIFGSVKGKTGYGYGLIIDPVYTVPEVVLKAPDKDAVSCGSIDFASDKLILRDGRIIKIESIGVYDVLYEVTDTWGNNPYIYVVKYQNVHGYIAAMLPNAISPNKIKLSTGDTYDFSKYMKFEKVNTSDKSFGVDDYVNLILDKDGKVIDLFGVNF